MDRFFAPFDGVKPVVGMVHLRPLPGTRHFEGAFDAVVDAALVDAWHLAKAGFDGLIVENLGDIPFRKNRVEPQTIACMTVVASEIAREIDIPMGVNVLRNDGFAAAGIASASGARFARVNVLSGAAVTDQGIIEGEAAELISFVDRVAPWMTILADINVKHAAPIAQRPLEDVARDTAERDGADALVVTGIATGQPVDQMELDSVRNVVGVPVIAGSGVTVENAKALYVASDGLIVGSSIKESGYAPNPVDPDKARRVVEAAKD